MRRQSQLTLPGFVATPHIIIEGRDRFELAIARCRSGFLFPDQQERVHTIFVLANSLDQRSYHLRALSAMAQIIQTPDFEQAWLTAPDAEALRRIILRASCRRLPEPPSSYESAVML
jgi:mannitol/fructose-specific phosphotransferase system IIA component (Ntr-type)